MDRSGCAHEQHGGADSHALRAPTSGGARARERKGSDLVGLPVYDQHDYRNVAAEEKTKRRHDSQAAPHVAVGAARAARRGQHTTRAVTHQGARERASGPTSGDGQDRGEPDGTGGQRMAHAMASGTERKRVTEAGARARKNDARHTPSTHPIHTHTKKSYILHTHICDPVVCPSDCLAAGSSVLSITE